MTEIEASAGARNPQTALGRALRIAWSSYMQRLDTHMQSEGFDKQRFAMLYMYAVYAEPDPMTISELGRRFAVSRQAASVNVGILRRDGYVTVGSSATDNREKVVRLTPRAVDYVTERLRAAAALDDQIRSGLGDTGLNQLLEALATVADITSSTRDVDTAGWPEPNQAE